MINISKIAVIMIAFLAITTTSCKKDNFDEPPFETVDPNLPVMLGNFISGPKNSKKFL
jgi:hypothetical protein